MEKRVNRGELNEMPTVTFYKLMGGILFLLVFGATCAFCGWRIPHDELTRFRAEVEAAGRVQQAQSLATDTKHQQEMKNAAESMVQAVGGIDSYYKQHPVVRVRDVCPGGSGMPQTAGGAEGIDAATVSGYVSPYSPQEVEKVAAQLNELQLLLLRDGVTVE